MNNRERNVMNSVNVDRLNLLEILRQNLKSHVTEYEELIDLYKKTALEIANTNLKIAKENVKIVEDSKSVPFELKPLKSMPVIPTCYDKEYNRAIRMLELSTDTVINLEQDVFNQLVLDEWGWKQSFNTTSAFYKNVRN